MMLLGLCLSSGVLGALVGMRFRKSDHQAVNQPAPWKWSDEKIGNIVAWARDVHKTPLTQDEKRAAIDELENLNSTTPLEGLLLRDIGPRRIPFNRAASVVVQSTSVQCEWNWSSRNDEQCILLVFSLPDWRIVEAAGFRRTGSPARNEAERERR
jgi:hypothetical protein